MHELSIVDSIVGSITEWLADQPPCKIQRVNLRVGALSGVVEDALQFCYGVATEGTPLAGSTLVVHHQPVVIYCPDCGRESELEAIHSFRCPACGIPSGDVRKGRDLEIESLQIDESS